MIVISQPQVPYYNITSLRKYLLKHNITLIARIARFVQYSLNITEYSEEHYTICPVSGNRIVNVLILLLRFCLYCCHLSSLLRTADAARV